MSDFSSSAANITLNFLFDFQFYCLSSFENVAAHTVENGTINKSKEVEICRINFFAFCNVHSSKKKKLSQTRFAKAQKRVIIIPTKFGDEIASCFYI